MASTASPTPTTPPPQGTEPTPFVERLEKYRKPLTWAVGIIAVLAVGTWLYMETGRRKAAAAADALDVARGTFESGNLPAASSAFQRVIQAYGGTDAGFQ